MPNLSSLKIELGLALEITDKFKKAKELERQQFIDFHIECMKKGLEVDGIEWKELYLPKITDVAIKQFDSIFKA